MSVGEAMSVQGKRTNRTELPPGARWRGKRIQVQVYRGYDAATKRRLYASGTVGTIEEAWQLWAELRKQVEAQTYVPPTRQTVAAFLDEWLEDSVKPNVKERTYDRYEADVRLHIKPNIGAVQLRRLTPERVEKMLADLSGTISDTSRLHVFRVLSRALTIAVRWRRVGRNVCDALEPPKATEPEMYVMSGAEVNRLLNVTEGDRLHALYVTAIHTGMRRGELFGLRWSDIDLDEGVAWVRQSLQTPGKNPVFSTPKSGKARLVPLAEEVIDALTSLKVDQEIERAHYGQDYRDYDLVFCQQTGAPIDGSSFARWNWYKMRDAAGLPDIVRFHDLRHTFVSRALAAGASLRAISDMVGHHDPGFTARRYAHALQEDQEKAVRLLGEYLSRTASTDPEVRARSANQ